MKDKRPEFLEGERLADCLGAYVDSFYPPFSDGNRLLSFLVKLGLGFSSALENLLGRAIYLKKKSYLNYHILPRFHRIINKLYDSGVIKKFFFPSGPPDWPKIPFVRFELAYGSYASGYGEDWNGALRRGVAEALERYSCVTYEKNKFVSGSWSELKNRGAVDPRKFSGFAQSQLSQPDYEKHKIDEHSIFNWVKAVSFVDGSEYLVPAQLAYYGYKLEEGESKIREFNSNGAAAGISREMAIHNALMELIERDSFMVYWLNKMSPYRIDIANLVSPKIKKLLGLYKKYLIDFTLLDITSDLGVPVIMNIIREKTPRLPNIYVATKASFCVEEAILAVLQDGILFGMLAQILPEEQKIIDSGQESKIETMAARRLYWCSQERLQDAAFLLEGSIKSMNGSSAFSGISHKNKIDQLRTIFQKNKINAYLVDITSAVAKEAGLKVFSAITSELYPLYLNEHFKYLGYSRLYEAPVKMGVFKQPKKEEEMNSIPHPFL